MKRFWKAAAFYSAMLIGTLGFANSASADLVFELNQSGCCGSIDFGTVTLDDTGTPGEVIVTVHLIEPDPVAGIVNSGLTSFLFNNSIALTSANVTSMTPGTGFTWVTDPNNLKGDGAGTFQYGFDCGSPACSNGGSGPYVGDFSFTLLAAGLSSATFTPNPVQGNPVKGGNYFAVDICLASDSGCQATGLAWTNQPCIGPDCVPPCTGPQCCTGPNCNDQNVPEPTSLALLGAGALALVAKRRRMLQKA